MGNGQEFMGDTPYEWPYPIRYDVENEVSADVLVLGGGIAGCWAAIMAAREGMKVILVDKGSVTRSGGGGTGCDHWQWAASNPASKISPEELAQAIIDNYGGYNCGISRYIQCREGYDVLLELEEMGVKIRDTNDEFVGAEFRDPETKFLFAYDYENRYTIRFWGRTIKPLLEKECKRLGVEIFNRVMVTSLLTEGGKQGTRVVGATGINVRTGEFYTFKGKATGLCLARPERQWIFSTELTGLWPGEECPESAGDGHAMAWRAGAEFTLMERSIKCPGSFAYPFFGTGNPIYTWYPATIVDSNGKEIPWIDRDGNVIQTVSERTRPAPGQKIFLEGGGAGIRPGIYEYRAPDIIPDLDERIAKGEFALPLYADLTSMPGHERRVIFGLMVGQEGMTSVPIYENYTRAGFNPDIDMLQCYSDFVGAGPPQWRNVPFSGGGVVVDWDLKTNLEGLYAAGTQIFSGEDHSMAATTGRHIGRKMADYAKRAQEPVIYRQQVEDEKTRVYEPVKRVNGTNWKELNAGICRVMQDYCGEMKNDELLKIGLKWLSEIQEGEATQVHARNPHELMRVMQALTILAVGDLVFNSCLARKASSRLMDFTRLDYPEQDPPEWHKWVTVKQESGEVKVGEKPIDYWGPLKENYEINS